MDYRIKISVDFGSTVSVLAWQLSRQRTGILYCLKNGYTEKQ